MIWEFKFNQLLQIFYRFIFYIPTKRIPVLPKGSFTLWREMKVNKSTRRESFYSFQKFKSYFFCLHV